MNAREIARLATIDGSHSRRFTLSLMEFDRWRFLQLTRWTLNRSGEWTPRESVPFPFKIVDELIAGIDRGLEVGHTGKPAEVA